MTHRILLAACIAGAALLLWLSLAMPVGAQSPCAPRDAVVAQLAREYAEHPVARGLGQDGSMVEVFTTEDGSTWTIIVTLPGGMSCPGGSGKAWQTLPVKKTGWRI